MIGAYTAATIAAVVIAVLLDLLVVRTRLIRTRLFWAGYAIILFFQLIVNGLLTGLGVVRYDSAVITGVRLVFAPVEDIGFGFALILLTFVGWSRLGMPPPGTSRPETSRPETTRPDRPAGPAEHPTRIDP